MIWSVPGLFKPGTGTCLWRMISTSFAQTLGVALQLASATAALAQAPVITVIAPLAQMNRTMRGC